MSQKTKKVKINKKHTKPDEYISMLTSYTSFLNHSIRRKKIKGRAFI